MRTRTHSHTSFMIWGRNLVGQTHAQFWQLDAAVSLHKLQKWNAWFFICSHAIHPFSHAVKNKCITENFTYRLELNWHWHSLTWEATPHSIHKGITTAIMNSDCLVFIFSLLWSRRNTGYTRPALRGSEEAYTLRPLGSWLRRLPRIALIQFLFLLTLLFRLLL